ncbi:MAG: iron-containing alcohol dehydrogenase [Deltaproteobacteria bacterium]|jgi:alcohol dehydrogenase|nr:iron-containing alcohol dehydrogenase [Deltaproteobacteria bacterium]
MDTSILTKQMGLWREQFTYYLPTKIFFGNGVSARTGEIAAGLGLKKVLVITDNGISKLGLVEEVAKTFSPHGISYEVYEGVLPNPTIGSVYEALEAIKKFKPDGVLALGGGSSIDVAKLATVLENNDDSVPLAQALAGVRLQNGRRIPLIAIETAAGTGAEITLFAVCTDEVRKFKGGVADTRMCPEVAICDPLLTVTLPPKITAETGVDAFSHALEAYVALDACPITDALAVKSMEMIFQNLREAVFNGGNIVAREAMLLANLIAGMAFPYSGTGMVHGMAEPISGMYGNLSHGLTISIMMPYVEKYNLPSQYKKFANLAKLAGEATDNLSEIEQAHKGLGAIAKLGSDVGIPSNLKVVGVKPEDFPKLADVALQHGAMNWNPRKMTRADILEVYAQAYEGNL